MRLMAILVAGLALLGGVAEADDLERSFDSGDVPGFFRQAEALAARGDAQAAFLLGKAYHQGRGVPADTGKAREYYRLAAAQDHARAEHNLGVLDLEVEGRPDLARGHFLRALALGLEMPTQANLGKAEQALCDQSGSIENCHAAGEAYLQAWRIDRRIRYLDAAVVGFAHACLRQRQTLLPAGVPGDEDKDCRRAADLAEEGAALGSAPCAYNRGVLDDAAGLPQSALPWFKLAAEGDFGQAAYTLGEMFERGRGTAPDEAAAQAWFRRSAELQYEPALRRRQSYWVARINSSFDVAQIRAAMGEWQSLDRQHGLPEAGLYRLKLIETLAENGARFPGLSPKSLSSRLCLPSENLFWNTEWRIFAVGSAQESMETADALAVLAQGRADKNACLLLARRDRQAILKALAAGKTPMLNWPGQRRLLTLLKTGQPGRSALLTVGMDVRY